MANEVTTQDRSVVRDMSERYGMMPDAFEATVRATCMSPDRNGNVPNKAEFAAFLLVAKHYSLNPLLKEIYAYPKKGGGVVPVVSIDGWISLINRQESLDGFDISFEHSEKGDLIAATCTIYRRDRSRPIVVTEYLAECIRSTEPWAMKHRMLRHKVLIQAARYAFGFGGIHDDDEAVKIADMRDVTPSDDAPTPPRETPPTAPVDTLPARAVEGEILPPKKAETAKPASAGSAETSADPKPKETPKPAAEEKKQEAPAADPSANGHGTRGSAEFEAYAKALEAEMMAAVDDKGELQEIWKRRNKEWSEQELKWLVDIRDEMVVRHKDRKKAREEAAAARQAETVQDDADDTMPGLGEEDFNEFDFRQAFTIRLGECKTAKEVLALKNEVDALKEKGLIVPSKYESIYEDALVTALERHE